jgi:GT2 family glycosyltransferase
MSTSLPLVTVVTPSYNQAAFLEQTIHSVLEQDYPAVEYLVIDGGSSDGSLEIIQKYASRLAGWVSEADRGQADAINKGFRQAHGEIVAWLNSDDLYLPGAISGAVAALQADPSPGREPGESAGMVYGDALTIDPQGRTLKKLAFPDWSQADLCAFRIICQPAVFMRRQVLEQAGYLDLSYHYMLDHHLWLRIGELGHIRHVPRYWAAARFHPAAKNVSQATGFSRETMRLLDWMKAEPGLSLRVAADRRRIEAGAYRLNARYLLDGGIPGAALQAYGHALWRDPLYTLQHWHRMLYAVMSLLGGKGLARLYYRLRRGRIEEI